MIRGIPEALITGAVLTVSLAGIGASIDTIAAVDIGAGVFIMGYLSAHNNGKETQCGILLPPSDNSSHSDN